MAGVLQLLSKLSRSGRFGLFLFALLLFTALFAPLLSPHDPYQQSISNRLIPPVWMERGNSSYPLGTDQLGRDNLSRLIYGARISLLVGSATVIIAGFIGVVLGLLAGYFGGRTDVIITTIIDAAWSFPFILLALIIAAALGSSLNNLIIALVATSWAPFARIVRGEVVALREREYIEAARATGVGAMRIISKHVLPNVASSILVIASIEFGRAILRESFLSFLGLGVPPAVPSWGGILSEARVYIFTMGWLVIFPGVAIYLATLGVNLFGDGLRDYFDPKLRGR